MRFIALFMPLAGILLLIANKLMFVETGEKLITLSTGELVIIELILWIGAFILMEIALLKASLENTTHR